MSESDKALLQRYRNGDIVAMEMLVEKYRRPLFSFIMNMVGNAHEANDVFQETWFRAIGKLGQYRQGNFFGWLARIARNRIIDQSRRRRPDVSLDDEIGGASVAERQPRSAATQPDRALDQEAFAQDLARAVARLPPEQREVFVLRVQAETGFKEIARIQGASINTVLARMQYAVRKLRRELKEYESMGGA